MVARIDTRLRYRALKTGLVGTSLVGALALTSVAGTVAKLLSAADAPSPAPGQAQVIAQSVIDFAAGSYAWSVRNEVIAIDEANGAYETAHDGFLVVDEGALLLTDDDDRLRLPGGEAAFRGAGSEAILTALGTEDAAYYALELLPVFSSGDDGDQDTAVVETGAGMRDVDLVRNVLDGGDRMTIAGADAAALLLVT